ncbi:1277_t:CDS:2 [Paraglomus brasilianum]|uniref:1277_t:CDS:1 n=1 Tax=Paraglomus brasilianum TaxID=144538 RepID=A0A9N9DA04_9GLOM|nr:1277_t:CDS:2 [Paraglomus brasilianum]
MSQQLNTAQLFFEYSFQATTCVRDEDRENSVQAWQSQPWNHRQQEESVQHQLPQQHTNRQIAVRYPASQPIHQEYISGLNQRLSFTDFLNDSQDVLQTGQQLSTVMFTSSGRPTYFISQLAHQQQTPPVYIYDSNLTVNERLPSSIQPPNVNGGLFSQQNLPWIRATKLCLRYAWSFAIGVCPIKGPSTDRDNSTLISVTSRYPAIIPTTKQL